MATNEIREPTRRDFLRLVTGMAGSVGVAGSAWPFIDHMRRLCGVGQRCSRRSNVGGSCLVTALKYGGSFDKSNTAYLAHNTGS